LGEALSATPINCELASDMGNWASLKAGLFRLAVMLCVGGMLGGCGHDQVVQTWVAYSEESSVPEGPKLPGHMYLLRGLTTIYSFGIDQLAAKINHRGVTATVYGLSDSSAITSDIIRKYKSGEDRGPVMLLGHSSGADYAIAIAERLREAGVPVALAFGFDPTRIADAVPANVELFINLYQGANLIGGGEVQPAPDFRGRLIEVDLREHTEIVHITLDKTPAVQDTVADKVIAVAAHAARRSKEPPRRPAGAEPRPLLLKYSVPGSAPIVLWDDAIQVKVKPGETLESVALTYRAPAWAIVQINKLDADRPLESGRMLTIPRSLYANVTPPGAPSPPAAPVARLGPNPPPQADAPAAPRPPVPIPAAVSAPKPVEPVPARDTSSFSDRWRSNTEQ
jgi:LysM repeat protein